MSRLKERIKQFRLIIGLLIVVIVVLVFLMFNMRDQGSTLPSEAIEKVSIRDVERVVSVDGKLRGIEESEVVFPSQSRVVSVNVEVGDRVKVDQVLAEVEVNGAFSTSEEKIKAPIAGLVTEVNVDEDTFSPLGTFGVRIVDDSRYVVEVSVNENDIVDVKRKQTTTLVFPALSFKDEYDGKVIYVAPDAEPSTSAVNYIVRVKPDTVPKKVRLGMSVDIEILTAKVQDVIAVPESSVIERDDKNFVKVLTYDNEERTEFTITEVEVTTGLETDRFIEIESGLSEGDEIVEPSFTATRSFFIFN
ncbi:MAG: efflux RND transporter periplasmic adaptor subunit [Candidatus Dojkabacteria bacterium]